MSSPAGPSPSQEPLAPFVFHEDESFVGEGVLLRSRRRRLITIAGVVLLVLAAVLVVQGPRFLAARSLDPAVNSATGLADGRYVLEPTASMHDDGRCWFRGSVREAPQVGSVTIAGAGLVQCAGSGDYVGRVEFTVVDGRAQILRARGY